MRRNRMVVAVGALALVALAAKQPAAELRILTHDAGDPAPHKVQAALDLGVASASLLVTWTTRLAR
jgi:hypothetical protein